jgi:hypothetical protein
VVRLAPKVEHLREREQSFMDERIVNDVVNQKDECVFVYNHARMLKGRNFSLSQRSSCPDFWSGETGWLRRSERQQPRHSKPGKPRH